MGEGGPLNFPLTLILAPKGRGELRGTFFYAIFMTQATPANHEIPPRPPLGGKGGFEIYFLPNGRFEGGDTSSGETSRGYGSFSPVTKPVNLSASTTQPPPIAL